MSAFILKTAEAPSLSGKSTLTYQIGATSPDQLFIRISGNSGGGLYCKEWFDLSAIESCLSDTASDSRMPDSQDSAVTEGVTATVGVEGVEVGADRQNFPSVGPTDLRAVIGRRSINTLGFVMAALKHLGLVRPSKQKPGKFIPQSTDGFRMEMVALFHSLPIDTPPSDESIPDSSSVTEEIAEKTPIAKSKRKSK